MGVCAWCFLQNNKGGEHRMNYKHCLPFIFFLFVICANAQQVTIVGGVSDPMLENGLPDAKVTLLNEDSVEMDSTLTQLQWVKDVQTIEGGRKVSVFVQDEQSPAEFTFENIEPGNYILKVELRHYETLYHPVSARGEGKNKVIDVGDLWLTPEARQLGEAVVKGTQLKFVYRGDTLVYNAAAFHTADGDMLGDLIEKLPGASIDDAGNISVNGRKVESLLINGKDFFNGNVEQALRSLPAFTVNKIKAYEKSGEMSETTGVDMHDKVYTMDVRLKRQYDRTWTGSFKAGGGTDNRYNLFGTVMRMDSRQAFSFLGELNNTNTRYNVYGPGTKMQKTETDGIHYYRAAWANYRFEPDRKFRMGLSASVQNWHDYTQSGTASETFLTGGNMYGRSESRSKNVATITKVGAQTLLRPKKGLMFKGQYDFSYTKNEQTSHARSAGYVFNPDDSFSSSVLDSTFALPTTADLLKSTVQSRLREENAQRGHTASHKASIETQKAFGADLLSLNGSVSAENRTSERHNLYNLEYPIAGTSGIDRLRYYDKDNRDLDISAGAKYIWKYAMNDSVNGELRIRYGFEQDYSNVSSPLYALYDSGLEQLDELTLLPSTAATLLQSLDPVNSFYGRQHHTFHTIAAEWTHEMRLASGRWLQMEAKLPFVNQYSRQNYDRNNLSQRTKRRANFLNPSVTLRYNPCKGDRQGEKEQICFSYNLRQSTPSMQDLLTLRDSSDPLNIFVGNPSLHNTQTHGFSLDYMRRLTKRSAYFNSTLYVSLMHNAIATEQVYDLSSGVRTYTPVNIDGNRSVRWSNYSTFYADKKKNWVLTPSLTYSYQHSRDLNARIGEEDRMSAASNVSTHVIEAELKVLFAPIDAVSLEGRITPKWRHLTGDREGFTTINALDVQYRLNASFSLPAAFYLRTDINFTTRSGYSDASLNDLRTIWNAKLERKFKKNFSLSFEAFDLLRQNKSIQATINSQGRTEHYAQTLPAYFMFGVSWNFTKIQGTKKKADKGANGISE